MMLEKIESNGGILIKYNTLLQYMLMPPNSEIVSNAKDHINVVWRGNGVNTYFTITPAFKVVIVQWEFKGGALINLKQTWDFSENKMTQQEMINQMEKDIALKMEAVFPSRENSALEGIPIGSSKEITIPASTGNNVNTKSKSDYLDTQVIDSQNLFSWEETVADVETDIEFKEVIEDFMIPYKISVLKYSFNAEYYQYPYTQIGFQEENVAPSLKIIKNNSRYKVRFYPSWFYVAFPDVLKWAVDPADGFPEVEAYLMQFPALPLGEQKHNCLKQIIEMYYSKHQSLECQL